MIDYKEFFDVYDNNIKMSNELIEYIFNPAINDCIGELDALMSEIKENIYGDNFPSKQLIEKYFKQLSITLYFTSTKIETFGLNAGLSKGMYKDKYNKSYLQASADKSKENKKTATEITAFSENEALKESLVQELFDRAYKVMRLKLDSAQTMVSTLSKMYSSRIETDKFENNYDGKVSRMILNEEVPFN